MLSLLLVAALVGVGAQANRVRWSEILEQSDVWYGSAEAHAVADNVVRYQRASGGWPKDIDMAAVSAGAPAARPDATIDNGATTTQIRFLARFPESRYREAVLKGIDYLLDAQYPNGGWPQFFPLRRDYSRYITFNDNAMANALAVLEEAAAGTAPFGFVDQPRRTRAADAVTRAVAVIQKSQVVVKGTPTVWGGQHDEVTLEPRAARTFEPVSLASMESVGVVRFLMRRPKTIAIERAVDAAIAWFTATRLPDGRWARFYEIGTNRPIFAGRDGVVRYTVADIEKERQDGYAWYGTWPRELLEKAYPAWRGGAR